MAQRDCRILESIQFYSESRNSWTETSACFRIWASVDLLIYVVDRRTVEFLVVDAAAKRAPYTEIGNDDSSLR